MELWRFDKNPVLSGAVIDCAHVGFRLSERGFAPNLPWASMAFSADPEMRQLAAALITFRTTIDYDGATSLATDTVTNVRCEMAVSLKKLEERGDRDESHQEQVRNLIASLREDPSYRVRSALPSIAVAAGNTANSPQ